MTTPTYEAIASVTLSSTASSIEFSSIPQTYRDLVLIVDCSISGGNTLLLLDINGTGSSGTRVFMAGNGSSASSGTQSNLIAGFFGSTRGSSSLKFFDYSATDKNKTFLQQASMNGTGEGVAVNAQRWANNSAITSIDVFINSNTFDVGSVFSLYGIEA